MQSFNQLTAHLRRQGRKNYLLLMGCCFFSVLLITAYVSMMRSPTVLSVLPEGGDSRKQVMMVFVLAVVGCAVFTTYASGLFLRSKSRETGIFLALGASRAQVRRQLYRDLGIVSVASCAAGALLGTPLAWVIWQIFRLVVVDSEEMVLSFDPQAYLYALAFSVFVIAALFLMAARFIRRTNIIDIVNEARKSEPIREVKPWYGRVGILLLVAGGVLGYMMPSFFVRQLHWYAPGAVTAIFYLPAMVGLYMVLLHTVVNGWGRGRNRYKHIISTSQMRFQGRQTVRNMLVITVLVAGAYFASFYAPMLSTSSSYQFDTRPVDYAYHFRSDQDIPLEDEVRQLAADYGVIITTFTHQPSAILGTDGTISIEQDNGALGTTYTEAYREIAGGASFLPESAYNALTGQGIDIPAGTCANVLDDEGGSSYLSGGDVTHLTNMATGASLDVTPADPLRCTLLLGYYVLDDADYAAIAADLTPDWREEVVFFNVEDVEATYPFAKALFNEIVDRSEPEVEVADYWDPVQRELAIAETGRYDYDDPAYLAEADLYQADYGQRDSSDFRNYWKYMPQFRVLDENDFLTTMAVFLMLFIFIALICFAAVLVIAYTRCLTIAAGNVQVYDDLRHLGASPWYLYCTVRRQVSRVFVTPVTVGTAAMWGLYLLIMYFNGEPYGYTGGELAGMGSCLLVTAGCSALIYVVYRLTLRQVLSLLHIHR